MNKELNIKRGDIFFYDFGDSKGSIQSGKRPVLVVQADNFNQNAPTIIVAAITTVIKKQYMPSHIILPDDTGLKQASMVMLEQIRAVNKDDLTQYVGALHDEQTWKYINNGLKKEFGLWFYRPERSGDIRCLCGKCVRDYMDNTNYVVKRLDPFAKVKDHCIKCNEPGYDYLLYDRRQSH